MILPRRMCSFGAPPPVDWNQYLNKLFKIYSMAPFAIYLHTFTWPSPWTMILNHLPQLKNKQTFNTQSHEMFVVKHKLCFFVNLKWTYCKNLHILHLKIHHVLRTYATQRTRRKISLYIFTYRTLSLLGPHFEIFLRSMRVRHRLQHHFTTYLMCDGIGKCPSTRNCVCGYFRFHMN